jgi:hypothetical protein
MRDKHNNPTDIPAPNPWDMNMSYLKILKATFCALCAHVLAWLLTPAASYAPDQLAP